MREVERADAVARDLDVVALHPQRALQDLRDRVVVLDDQDAGWAFVLGHSLLKMVRRRQACRPLSLVRLDTSRSPGRSPAPTPSKDSCPDDGRHQDQAEQQGSKRKPPPEARQRSLLASRPSLALPELELEPHQVDIIGLALIAIGVFLAASATCTGPAARSATARSARCRFVFGALGYAVPVALVLAGALVLMRELRPPARPMRTGVICLTAALTLGARRRHARARSRGRHTRARSGTPASFEARGGIIGEAELWVASHLISTVGADILAVFLFARRADPRHRRDARRRDPGDRRRRRGTVRAHDRRSERRPRDRRR